MKLQFMIALLVMAIVCAAKSPNHIGEFKSKDGGSCRMMKVDMGPKLHAIVVECNCSDSVGLQQTYACSYYYTGEFDNCFAEEEVYRQTELEMAGTFCVLVDLV